MRSFIPSFLRPVMTACLRECVNALMKIKRWMWVMVSELGLEGRKIGWVACLKQDLRDFRICRITDTTENNRIFGSLEID